MKKVSIVFIIILSLFMLTSCETLGFGSGLSDFFNFDNWTLFEKVDDLAPSEEKKIVDVIDAKVTTVATSVSDAVDKVSDEVIDDAIDVVDQVSSWFEVQEEKIEDAAETAGAAIEDAAEKTEEVVESTAKTIENAVSDVLSAITGSNNQSNPVIVVPSKNSTTTEDNTSTTEETKSATEQALESLSNPSSVENVGSSAVLIIILVAIGLIGIAIAYYCVSIKKKSY